MPPNPVRDWGDQNQQNLFIENGRGKDQGRPMSHLLMTCGWIKICPDNIPTFRDIYLFSGFCGHYHSFPTGSSFNHALSSASKITALGSHWLKSSSRV